MLTTFLKKHVASTVLSLLFMWFFVYSTALTFLNWDPPDPGSLQSLDVEFLRARAVGPQFQVKVKGSGEQVDLYLPTLLYGAQRGPSSARLLSKTENEGLADCSGVVQVAPVQWIVPERLFVWELKCGDVWLPYERIAAAYLESRQTSSLHVMWWGYGVFGIGLIVFIFLKESGIIKRRI